MWVLLAVVASIALGLAAVVFSLWGDFRQPFTENERHRPGRALGRFIRHRDHPSSSRLR
jgi:hypothetical protein